MTRTEQPESMLLQLCQINVVFIDTKSTTTKVDILGNMRTLG